MTTNQTDELQALLAEANAQPGVQDAVELYRQINELVQANNDLIYQVQVFSPMVVVAHLSPSPR